MLIAISCTLPLATKRYFVETHRSEIQKNVQTLFLLCWNWIVYLQNCKDPSVTCTVTKQTSRNPLIPAASMHMLLELLNQIWNISMFCWNTRGPRESSRCYRIIFKSFAASLWQRLDAFVGQPLLGFPSRGRQRVRWMETLQKVQGGAKMLLMVTSCFS